MDPLGVWVELYYLKHTSKVRYYQKLLSRFFAVMYTCGPFRISTFICNAGRKPIKIMHLLNHFEPFMHLLPSGRDSLTLVTQEEYDNYSVRLA